jgi:hypothetical protein
MFGSLRPPQGDLHELPSPQGILPNLRRVCRAFGDDPAAQSRAHDYSSRLQLPSSSHGAGQSGFQKRYCSTRSGS